MKFAKWQTFATLISFFNLDYDAESQTFFHFLATMHEHEEYGTLLLGIVLKCMFLDQCIRVRYYQGDYNGGITPVENGRRFLTPLVCVGCLLRG